jgi:hypothetical protein
VLLGLIIAFVAAVVASRGRNTKPFGTEAGKEGEEVQAIGPIKGAELSSYISARDKALAGVKGPRLAVVSLTDYRSEADARAAVPGLEVVSMLAAAPGGAPSTLSGDVKAWVNDQKRAATTERDQFQSMLPTVEDQDTKTEFNADIARLNALVAKLQPTTPVVFALVVRADAARLQALERSPGIRLVDVGASDRPAKDPQYRGIRPEETSKAQDPLYRPV